MQRLRVGDLLLAGALVGKCLDLRNILKQLLCLFGRDQIPHDDLLVIDRCHDLAGLIVERTQNIALAPCRVSDRRIHDFCSHDFTNTIVSV